MEKDQIEVVHNVFILFEKPNNFKMIYSILEMCVPSPFEIDPTSHRLQTKELKEKTVKSY